MSILLYSSSGSDNTDLRNPVKKSTFLSSEKNKRKIISLLTGRIFLPLTTPPYLCNYLNPYNKLVELTIGALTQIKSNRIHSIILEARHFFMLDVKNLLFYPISLLS